MTTPRFLQIHSLHSYPAALLNRDDSGFAKRMPFGDAVRTRISSQCLKRHWRDPKDEMKHEYALHRIPDSVTAARSRDVVERRVMERVVEVEGVTEDVVKTLAISFTTGVYGNTAKPGRGGSERKTRQSLLLGFPEVEHLSKKAAEIATEHPAEAKEAENAAKKFFDDYKKNFEVMREQLKVEGIPKGKQGGLEGALFGRMVTSDPGANIDAAVHVAHAFTVHREESERDYFSSVDDLQPEGEDEDEDEDPGAAYIGSTELTASLFYGYVVVDVPGLVSNLEGCDARDWESVDRSLAAQMVKHLVHLIATVSPSAKRGSTASHTRARFMLIEAGKSQPYSLADAFRKPVDPQIEDALDALVAEIEWHDRDYGMQGARRFMSRTGHNIPDAQRLTIPELASWAAESVRSGKA